MRTRLAPLLLAAAAALPLVPRAGLAAPELPAVFTDRMVLQQGQPVPVWGRAEPGEGVTVSVAGQRATAKADEKGRWACTLPPLEAGGPLKLSVAGSETLTLRDVWVGEVWLAAGGSNMALDVQRADDAAREIARAAFPRIRLYRVAQAKRGWQPCTPDTVGDFSAVAYFFGRHLHERLDEAVGLIESAEPRSPLTAWMSREALAAFPDLQRVLQRMDRYGDEVASRRRAMSEWWSEALPAALAEDPGSRGERPAWAAPTLPARAQDGWRPIELPRDPAQRLASPSHLPRGVVWFRREVELPQALAGKALLLPLGFADEAKDAVFLNSTPLAKEPGGYRVPPERAVAGRTVVALRMVTLLGRGLSPLYTDRDRFCLRPAEGRGGPAVPLAGTWLTRVGVWLRDLELPPLPPPLPPHPREKTSPAVLYRRHIEPLTPFALRGIVWYQGEADASRPGPYRARFPALITSWRQAWSRDELPFLFVQLAGCARKREEPPKDDLWARLREAQAEALRLPATAMAVAVDLGHRATPSDKQAVGRRLALLARARVYGEAVACEGPRFEEMTREGHRLRLRFANAEGGLTVRGGDASGMFAIAGEDRRFVWADAQVEGESVVVWSRQVPEPVAVRYAWEHTPGFAHRPGDGWVRLGLLFNQAGLPAAPFRTDRWRAGAD